MFRCSGFIINNAIVTARHCMRYPDWNMETPTQVCVFRRPSDLEWLGTAFAPIPIENHPRQDISVITFRQKFPTKTSVQLVRAKMAPKGAVVNILTYGPNEKAAGASANPEIGELFVRETNYEEGQVAPYFADGLLVSPYARARFKKKAIGEPTETLGGDSGSPYYYLKCTARCVVMIFGIHTGLCTLVPGRFPDVKQRDTAITLFDVHFQMLFARSPDVFGQEYCDERRPVLCADAKTYCTGDQCCPSVKDPDKLALLLGSYPCPGSSTTTKFLPDAPGGKCAQKKVTNCRRPPATVNFLNTTGAADNFGMM